jgi:hypothetical protein
VRRRTVCAWLVALLIAQAGYAYLPPPERIYGAIADTNKADGRDQAVKLELSMSIGERTDVATGELVSHPTGLARLELRGAGGLVERHLLQGNELSVTRNGLPLDDPRAFLPPFFILQADRSDTLRAALTTFAVLDEEIGLAECGDTDCLLIGDPARTVPRPDPPPVRGLDVWEAITGRATDDDPDGLAGGSMVFETDPKGIVPGEVLRPRVWVEADTYEVRGFDDANGVRIRLGPVAAFDKLRVPAWITVEEPGRVPARFDVIRATQVTAPASAFTRDWLFTAETGAPAAQGGVDAPPTGPAGR